MDHNNYEYIEEARRYRWGMTGIICLRNCQRYIIFAINFSDDSHLILQLDGLNALNDGERLKGSALLSRLVDKCRVVLVNNISDVIPVLRPLLL